MSASFEQRALGRTGLHVSVVGLGAGALGDPALSEQDAERLLQGALELGVTLIDTAPSYGASEERLGRHLGWRRQHVVLSTKVGYGVPGVADWTPACITAGVELALGRLRTDWLDVVHLHSCPREVLERPGLLEALEAAIRAGKVRVAAYSGENDALGWAIGCGRFGVVQRSVNLCDQGQLEFPPPPAIGVLAKRPLANAAWAFRDRPAREDVAVYWDRLRALGLDTAGLEWDELALRFAAFVPGVSSCLVGTHRLAALARACEVVARGPLLPELLTQLRAAWWRAAAGWPGLV
jgi:aryl-alcohol dehydrogenase-like predicted oxidoreductase